MYSQFTSKADLFFALLERRVAERTDQNDRLASELTGRSAVEAAMLLASRLQVGEPEWALLVIEFRTHAARNPELNERYRRIHAHTMARLAATITRMNERAGITTPFPASRLAELILAIGSGAALEQAADPDALPGEFVSRFIAHIATSGDDDERDAAARIPGGDHGGVPRADRGQLCLDRGPDRGRPARGAGHLLAPACPRVKAITEISASGSLPSWLG